MTKKYIGFLVLLVVLLSCLTAVSATDTTDNTTITDDITQTTTTNIEQFKTTENIQQTSTQKVQTQQETIENTETNKIVGNTNQNKKNQIRHIPGYEYVFANETLDITGNNYDGQTLTLLDNVNVYSSNNMPLTGTAFIVSGNNVNITGLKINNFNLNNSVVISVVNESSNVNIINNDISTTRSEPGKVQAIFVNSSNYVNIVGNTLDVKGLPQSLDWYNTTPTKWLSDPKLSGVLAINTTFLNLSNNIITVSNQTETTSGLFSTVEGITLKTKTRNSTINNNTVTIKGSEFIYGISTSDEVSYLNIINNKINLNGTNYICGINLDSVTYSNIESNQINGTCANISSDIASNESMAYGINLISQDATLDSETYTNTVSSNIINLTSTISYGIEGYAIEDTYIYNNSIYLYGNIASGMAYTMTYGVTIDSNRIIIKTNNNTSLRNVTEAIPPMTVGINYLIAPDDDQITINGNHILIQEQNNGTYYTIRLYLVYLAQVVNNYLTSSSNEITLTGNESVDYDQTLTYDANIVKDNYPYEIIGSNNVMRKNIILKNRVLNKKSAPKTIVLNANNFDNYVTRGLFNTNVNDGDTIDIDGKLDGTRFSLTVNKAVNIISSNHNAYLNLGTVSTDSNGGYIGGIFKIISTGSNSNISDIYFEATRISIENAKNISINNITVIGGDGRGVGSTSVRSASDNVTITNSLFITKNNGGYSNVVFAGSTNVLFENNTVIGIGNVGNLLYLTSVNAAPTGDGFYNRNITIRNNYINANDAYVDMICFAVALEGQNILLENNVIEYTGVAMVRQWVSGFVENVTLKNNTIPYGTTNVAFNNTKVYNNTIITLVTTDGADIRGNNLGSINLQENTTFEDNIVNGIVNVQGNNVLINNNKITNLKQNYTINTNDFSNLTISNNELNSNNDGDNSINGNAETIEGNSGHRYILLNEETRPNYSQPNNPYRLLAEKFKSTDYVTYDGPWTTANHGGVIFSGSRSALSALSGITFYNLNYINHTSFGTPGQLTTLGGQSRFAVNLENCFLPYSSYDVATGGSINLINSTLGNENVELYGAWGTIDENSYILSQNTIDIFENIVQEDGYLSEETRPTNDVYVIEYTKGDAIINQSINLKLLRLGGNVNNTITFISGSEGSNITDITFNDIVYVNTSYINFKNCIFNKGIIFTNADNNIIENSVINPVEEETPVIFVNSKNNQIINNNITSSNGVTISFDDDSSNNIVKENNLNATTKYNKDSVTGTENNVFENNGILYDVTIAMDVANFFYVGESVDLSVNVTDNFNNILVDNGYVEIYADGLPQATLNLTDGKATTKITVLRVLGTNVKVWYYPTEKYNTKTQTKDVTVKESTGNIVVEEITGTKVGEKIIVNVRINSSDVINEGNISFQFADSSLSVPVMDNVANITAVITPAMMDDPSLRLVFETDKARYNIKSTTATLTIEPGVANIIVDEVNSKIDDEVNLTAKVTDCNNENITSGEITFTNDKGETLATVNVTDGIASTQYTFTSEYNGTVIATFTSNYYQTNSAENTLNVRKINTILSLETTKTEVQTGETIPLTGLLTDEDNNPLTYKSIDLNINEVIYTLTSNDEGKISLPYSPTNGGTTTITAQYNGDDTYNKTTSNTITLNVTDKLTEQLEELQEQNSQLNDKIDNLTNTIDSLTNLINSLTELVNQQTEQNNQLQEQLANTTDMLNQLNDKIDNLTEANDELSQQLENTTNNLTNRIDELKEQIEALTDLIDKQNEEIAALSAPENTIIVLDSIEDAKYKSDVTIRGSLVSQKGLALSGQMVTIIINDDNPVNVVTDNGAFEYTTVVTSLGEQTVNVSYEGSDYYVSSDANTVFNVEKQDVIVTVEPISGVCYGDNVTITGKFTDINGKSISNSNVRIFVNGKKYLARTDKTGMYSLNARVSAVGENNLTFGYAGNENYNAFEDSIIFNADKQDVIVTVDVIEDTKVGENVTITGTFTDKNGRAIINSNVKILLNGKKYYAKTDSTGVYTFTITVTSAGINNIMVGYSGNEKYNSFEETTTFNVDAQDVIVTVNPIEEVTIGDNITISGTFTDKYGRAIISSNVKILLNGKKYYAKTDSTGAYTFTTTVTTEGTNNITAAYSGSAKYNAYETSMTFIAKAE